MTPSSDSEPGTGQDQHLEGSRAPQVHRSCPKCGTQFPVDRPICPYCRTAYRRGQNDLEGEGTIYESSSWDGPGGALLNWPLALVRMGPRLGVCLLVFGLLLAIAQVVLFGGPDWLAIGLTGMGAVWLLPLRPFREWQLVEPVWDQADPEGSAHRAEHFKVRKAKQDSDLWTTAALLVILAAISINSRWGDALEAEEDSPPATDAD